MNIITITACDLKELFINGTKLKIENERLIQSHTKMPGNRI